MIHKELGWDDPSSREKIINRNQTWNEPDMAVSRVKAAIIIISMMERKHAHNEWKDEKPWQRNRNLRKAPTGNPKTEKYNIQNKSNWMSLTL